MPSRGHLLWKAVLQAPMLTAVQRGLLNDLDAVLGIVVDSLRERLTPEEIPWNAFLKIQRQSRSFASGR